MACRARLVAGMLVAVVVAVPGCGGGKAAGSGFTATVDNPYFPLPVGTVLIYTGSRDGKRAVEVLEVTGRTKTILGAPCRVVHDRLYLDDALAEDTEDWYAQDRAGAVWYFGEATKTLDGHGKVTSTEGSFQAGVDGARQGIFMPARPKTGASYQQEYYQGQAEDHFRITSVSTPVAVPAGSYGSAVRTEEWTPLEPGVRSAKYYVRWIGTVREEDTAGGDEHLELIAVIRR